MHSGDFSPIVPPKRKKHQSNLHYFISKLNFKDFQNISFVAVNEEGEQPLKALNLK